MAKKKGLSLVEVMISLAILTIGIAGLVQSFGFIQKAVQLSKNKTLAANLAQEKMQILKQKTYYQVLVTTNPIYDTTDFAPDVVTYDTGYFPPEQVTEGGVSYTRYTYIESLKEDSGALGTQASNLPDVGMKRITITVTWGYGSEMRKATLRSILSNPDTITANSIFTGAVTTTGTLAAIGGALVTLVESPGNSDTTDSFGKYLINTTPGTYTLMVSATGYYSQIGTKIVAAGQSLPVSFALTKIGVGTITGYPWLLDHLVISQVVGSTIDTTVTPNFDQEYVEVFNPSTYSWTMNGNIGLKIQRSGDTEKTISINYLNPTVASGGYYLFANTGTINSGGVNLDADAVWAPGNSVSDFPYFASQGNIIPVDEDGNGEGGGALELYRVADGSTLDKVGWDKSGHLAPFFENLAIQQTIGLSRNELYARKSSIGDSGAVGTSYGPSFDSNDNNDDFVDYSAGINLPPHSSYSPVKAMLNGSPAFGAVVSCSDGLSASTDAIRIHGVNAPDFAYFSLVNVATGTWTIYIASGTNALPLAQSVITVSTAGLMLPMTTFLTEYQPNGFVTGHVRSTTGGPLSNITVTAPGATPAITAADGSYRLSIPPGEINVTANPLTGGSAQYVTVSSEGITVGLGMVHSGVDFVLYQGGRLNGFVTRDGTNGLPGVAMAILDWNSVARDQQLSDSHGRFTSVVLSTGLYTVYPSLGILEVASPAVSTVTLVSGAGAQFSSTFTIANALGYISGTVKKGGVSLNTGVLILVTTGTVTVPPDLSSNTLTGTPYYLASSGENGTYLAEVRSSTYNVYAYLSVPNSTGTVSILSSSTANVPVTAGQTTTGVNFSW